MEKQVAFVARLFSKKKPETTLVIEADKNPKTTIDSIALYKKKKKKKKLSIVATYEGIYIT
jgi:hypothetical protein